MGHWGGGADGAEGPAALPFSLVGVSVRVCPDSRNSKGGGAGGRGTPSISAPPSPTPSLESLQTPPAPASPWEEGGFRSRNLECGDVLPQRRRWRPGDPQALAGGGGWGGRWWLHCSLPLPSPSVLPPLTECGGDSPGWPTAEWKGTPHSPLTCQPTVRGSSSSALFPKLHLPPPPPH